MVQEFESRFSSDQQTILQALDPIHRSLLISNSEFESVNNNSAKPLNQSPTKTCELFKEQVLQQQQQQQQAQQENNNFYDASFSTKPDATCVSDSDCSMLFREEFRMPDELECKIPLNDKKQISNEMQAKKNIQIRIVTNTKRSTGQKSVERMSSESQTDSSTYVYVDTDSEVESSSAADENMVDYGGSSNPDEFSDYNNFNNFESSSNDEATTSSSDSSTPMIQIVQEITEQRTVCSTVHVNKKKVKSFRKTKVDRVTVLSKEKPKWKNKQKIIDDNVCNEILDETINWNVIEGEEQCDAIEPPSAADTILIGQLKAKPKYSQRKMGKLMERRLSRVVCDRVTLSPNHENNQSTTDVSSSPEPFHRASVAPAKPPRTFTSSSSKTSSDSIGGNTATTLPIEDFHKSLTSHDSPQMSPGGGWVFDKMHRATTKPTCPTLDDINDFEKSKKIGWVSSLPKREELFHVLNMLNDNHPIAHRITSANLTPEPQLYPCKEDIDQVDSSFRPKPALKQSRHMSMELNDSICSSTPVKRSSHFSSHSVPNSTHSEMEICKKCKLQIIKPSSARKSFGKGAIKRTKLFFKASKNIWNKPKPIRPMKSYENCSENEYYLDLDYGVDEETPSTLKLNTTADFNTNDTPQRIEKKTVKTLNLTPKQSDNNIESPRRILDKFLTSVKRTPPKKPMRQSLAHRNITRSPSNNEEEHFNFDRVVDSPKSKEKGFKLSPRKLFFATNERPNQMHDNSYRSFEADQKDDLKQCIVEYLRNMNEKIEHRQAEVECATVPRRRSRVRNFSISSDAIDYIPERQRVVQIDCHPEPLYSEIVVPPPTNSLLKHIIANDNPKAIYATVNKTRNRKTIAQMSADVHDIRTASEEGICESTTNSLEKLSINNNLADSILNMLELMKQQNLETFQHNNTQMPESDDFELQGDGSQVKNCFVVEPPILQLASERFQQSVFKAKDNRLDDMSSMETFFTESICDDVMRGDSVNDNIVSMIDQLENMDLVSTISLVESETDDEPNEHFHEPECTGLAATKKVESTRDDADYCFIIEENTTNGPARGVIDSLRENKKRLHLHTTTIGDTSDIQRNNKLQSPLVAAPSMIEIPDQFMLKLTNQIIAQREIRTQLKHAIKICRTTKEFECSSELIEAERLMLLSTRKEAAAKLELTRIDYEENGLTASPAKCVGVVTIKEIEFDLKSEEMLEQIFQLSYICICSYRDQVVATHAKERDGNKVRFNDIGIRIGRLNCAFEIKLEVYVLRLPRPLRKYSHESKYHLNKIPKKTLFPNPVKLFSNTAVSNSKLTSDLEESKFRLRGVTTISARSLSSEKFEIVRNTLWPNDHVYISYNTKSLNLRIDDQFTNMTGALRTEFLCEVNLSDCGLTGFLSITEESNAVRERWCRLIGCTMDFWNSDIDCLNRKAPLFSIDLIKCTNELFELINDRIVVDILNGKVGGQTEKNRINRYWIGANNKHDLILWLTDLNRILKFIKDWNI